MRRILFAVIGITLTHFTINNDAMAQEFVDISKGDKQICGITTTEQLLCSTASSAERLEPPENLPRLINVEVGESHACGLNTDGGIVCWGDNDFGQLNSPAGQGYTSLSVGWNHSCAIDTAANAICWGLSDSGRTEVPINLGPIAQVEASFENSCVLAQTGVAVCFGSDTGSTTGANIVKMAVAASPANSVVEACLLNQTGDIQCNFAFGFQGNYTDIAGWGSAMCALTSAGKIECQPRFSSRDITAANLAEVDQFNNEFNFVSLHGGQGLCASTDTGQAVCASAANLPGRINSPLSNLLPLPGVASDLPLAVDDLTAIAYSDSTVELFWSSIGKSGDGRVTGAQIFRDGEFLIEVDQLSSFRDTSLSPDVDYRFQVSIVNSRGDVGPLGNTVTINTSDRNGVVSPQTSPEVRRENPIRLRTLRYSNSVFELFWGRSDFSVVSFEVYRNHEFIGFTNGTSFFDETATDERIHYDVLSIGEDGQILGFAGVTSR